ncbi:MAG: inositol monophosphatase family protein [Stackebrandtia sp.]
MSDVPPADRAALDIAVRILARAGELSARRFFAEGGFSLKDDGTEVTAADMDVENLIRAELATAFPGDGVLGEEAGESAGASGRRWVVDPISGTAFFTRRMPLFANLLALEDAYGPALGIVNLPVQRELVFAGRGLGCWRLIGPGDRVAACRVGSRADLDGAVTLAMNQQTWPTDLVTALHRRVDLVGAINHPAAHVVTGRVDAAVITGQSYDDLAPLPVIVAEAGGRVTDLSGAPVLSGDGSVLITNGRFHDEFLALAAV